MLVDGHVDLTYFLMNLSEDLPLSRLEDGPYTLKKVKEVGLRLFISAIYCQDRFNGENSLGHLKDLLHFTFAHFNGVTIIRDGDDLKGLRKDPDGLGALLLLENADALVGRLPFVEELVMKGFRVVGLTHAGRNRIGDGNGVKISGGLTAAGIEVIKAIEGHGLLIDVAHLHPRCFWELLKVYKGPLVSSHTGMRELCDIQRNVNLEQVGKIMARDGLVGITFNPEMLSPEGKAHIEDVFSHIDLLVQKFGPEAVGLGSDFCGFEKSTVGLEDVTKIPHLREIMWRHGYPEEAIEKIMGLNWLSLFETLLQRHAPS